MQCGKSISPPTVKWIQTGGDEYQYCPHYLVDENNYTADVDVDNITGEMLVNLWEANTLIGIYNSASFPVNVMLSTELASLIKLNSVDEPANYAAKAYTHPDCLLATDINDEQNVQVFPNPTSNDLIINWKDLTMISYLNINNTWY